MDTLSVVIPLYNKERTIGASIESVLRQGYSNFELIVVNDGSTDASAEIVRGFTDERIWLIDQKNAGLSEARNTGIQRATGDLIALLDADDLWDPNHLETLANLAAKFPDASLIGTRYRILREGGRLHAPEYAPELRHEQDQIIDNFFRAAALGCSVFMPSAVMLRRSALNRVGLFRWRFGEDTDMWIRMVRDGPVALAGATTMNYRLYPDDPTSTGRKRRTLKDLNSPHFVDWPSLTGQGDYWFDEFVALKQIQQLTYFKLAGYNRVVRNELKKVHTRRFRKDKFILWLKTFAPSGMVEAASSAKHTAIKAIRELKTAADDATAG